MKDFYYLRSYFLELYVHNAFGHKELDTFYIFNKIKKVIKKNKNGGNENETATQLAST